MDIQKLNEFIIQKNSPSKSDIGSLERIAFEYPFFQAAIFIYLKAVYIHEPERYKTELERLSITIADRRALFYYIFSEEYQQFFVETGKKEIAEDKTNILLNAFFESRGETISDDMQLEYNISHSSIATTDYFSYIQYQPHEEGNKKESNLQLKHQDIIDNFITKSEEDGIHIQIEKEDESLRDHTYELKDSNEDQDELNEDLFFTETLAKIYIKQQKYEKAHKIIKHLSLNYPKKNIYFADQLSFLEKLIINSKSKDKK